MGDASSFLTAWSSFYVMTGSSAAALTGLMFVVISVVSGTERMQSEGADEGTAAFSTPTVLHFAAALLVSALLLAPWPSLIDAGVAAALVGLAGVANLARAMARTRRLSNYTADLEDWIWYTVLPLVAYAAILAGGIAVRSGAAAAFAVAGGVVLLIFIGIRNAWDIVTFLTVRGGGSRDADDRPSGSAG